MVGKALFAVSLTFGGWFGAGVAHADNVQNFGTYAGDVLKQLQDWGYNVMLNGLDRDVAYMDDFQKRDCQVLGIHPMVSEPVKSGEFQTVTLIYPARRIQAARPSAAIRPSQIA